MRLIQAFFSSVAVFARVSVATWEDCTHSNVATLGRFAVSEFNDTAEDGSLIFVTHPPLPGEVDLGLSSYPVIVFSHGTTGEYAMYTRSIQQFVSHGFVVIFPHVKSPTKDVSPFTLDPKGDFAIKGVHYAQKTNTDTSSRLYNMLDLKNLVLAGHSMGASTTIMAAKRLPAGTAKVAIAQHPGVCGPFGPPPSPDTWMPSDFEQVASHIPLVLTTATNDGAFWPAPHTAEHELGCFHKSTDGKHSAGSIFVQFSERVCEDDGTGGRYDRKWSTGGHDCPMKVHSVETPWVLVAAKLYAQLGGSSTSECYKMLWGDGANSLTKEPGVEKSVINPPATTFIV